MRKDYFTTILIAISGSFISTIGALVGHYGFNDQGKAGFFMFLIVTIFMLISFFTAPGIDSYATSRSR
ncbi:MAG: hypothetical protein V1770_06240 [bacterium]